jgi:hypothetical protein
MSKGTCRFEGCQGAVVGKRYCARHYKQWRRGALPKGRYKICSHEGCRKARSIRAKCEEHAKKASASPEAAPAAPASEAN